MSLSVYIGKRNLPADQVFLFDANAAFTGIPLMDDEFTKLVLKEVEDAEYVDKETFRDRFGRGLYSDCLSTSSKILLLVHYRPEAIVNAMELGDNAVTLLLTLTEGNVFYPDANVMLEKPDVDIMINGVHCTCCDEIEWRLEEIGRELLGCEEAMDEKIEV